MNRIRMSEYVGRSLYSSTTPYFESANLIAHRAAGIPFPSLSGEDEYRASVASLYAGGEGVVADQGVSWATPVEIFQPHFGRVLSRAVSSALSSGGAVVEIGGGTGTGMLTLLDALEDEDPEAYARLESYTVVEISHTLHTLQKKRLADGGRHMDKVNLVCSPFQDWTPPPQLREVPTLVLALEVLDNCPHDLIRWADGAYRPEIAVVAEDALTPPESRRSGSRSKRTKPVLEWVSMDAPELENMEGLHDLLEIRSQLDMAAYATPKLRSSLGLGSLFSGAADGMASLISSVMDMVPLNASSRTTDPSSGARHDHAYTLEWVPTAAFEILDHIHASLPQAGILMTDFDSLPGLIPFQGPLAPVVQLRDASTGETVRHESVLDPLPGTADIFHATDFTWLAATNDALRSRYARVPHGGDGGGGGEGEEGAAMTTFHAKHAAFIEAWIGDEDKSALTTKSGYIPIISDFSNVSFAWQNPTRTSTL